MVLLLKQLFITSCAANFIQFKEWSSFDGVYKLDSTHQSSSEDQLLTVLLYGSEKYALNVNKEIIRLTISFLKASERFVQPLFWPTKFVFIYFFICLLVIFLFLFFNVWLYRAFIAASTPFLKGELDYWTQWNPGETEIIQNQGGKGQRGERGIFKIFIGGKIAGDGTSNRKQNFRVNLKMFSWVI